MYVLNYVLLYQLFQNDSLISFLIEYEKLRAPTFGVLAANAEKTDNKIRINTNTFFIYQPVAVIVTLIEPT